MAPIALSRHEALFLSMGDSKSPLSLPTPALLIHICLTAKAFASEKCLTAQACHIETPIKHGFATLSDFRATRHLLEAIDDKFVTAERHLSDYLTGSTPPSPERRASLKRTIKK